MLLVCSCFELTECALREASAAGGTLEDVLRATRAGSACGGCREDVFRVLGGGPCQAAARPACAGCPARTCGSTD